MAGKEVALFVQEHLAEELVKLEEFKDGDFQQALIRCISTISSDVIYFVPHDAMWL